MREKLGGRCFVEGRIKVWWEKAGWMMLFEGRIQAGWEMLFGRRFDGRRLGGGKISGRLLVVEMLTLGFSIVVLLYSLLMIQEVIPNIYGNSAIFVKIK